MTVSRQQTVDGVLVGRGWRVFALPLLALLLLALLPRLYSAATLGWHWDHPGSFTLVNFDEGGSCRAALDGFEYTPFVGYQTIAIASALGAPPPADIRGRPAAVKAYCHSAAHLQVARLYSAVTGALTAPLLVWLGLMLWPGDHRVGWTAGLLTALSGFHISESHSGTVDAPSVFFIYLLLACLVAAAVYRRRALLWAGALLLLPALWAKYWLFALFALLPLLPGALREGLVRGWSPTRGVLGMVALALVFACLANSDFRQAGYYPLVLLFYLVVPWRALAWPMRIAWLLAPACAWLLLQLPPVAAYTLGGMTGNFGSGYAAIGWHKFVRNLVNIPVVLLVGLGLPAFLCLWPGLRVLWRRHERLHGWQYLLPLALFLLYMATLAPVTYYRHYLVLIPGATLLAAIGYWSLSAANKPLWLALFLLWPAALALDLNLDYHRDPRIELRDWYAARQPQRVLVSYYVNPPVAPATQHRLFRPEYAAGDAAVLRSAQYLVLSENWYDTAFANELNGSLVNDLDKLIKTRPEYARFYRQALAGSHPWLATERHISTVNFMPELVLHKALYGSFQMFVGDIVVLRVREPLR